MTKTEKALEVLKAGGYFRKALETQYRGGEKFEMRLRNAQGEVVKGFGYATFYALEKSLKNRACQSSSVWPQEWELA